MQSFQDARRFVRSQNIGTVREHWRMWCRGGGNLPSNIPASPDTYYPGEFINWHDWLVNPDKLTVLTTASPAQTPRPPQPIVLQPPLSPQPEPMRVWDDERVTPDEDELFAAVQVVDDPGGHGMYDIPYDPHLGDMAATFPVSHTPVVALTPEEQAIADDLSTMAAGPAPPPSTSNFALRQLASHNSPGRGEAWPEHRRRGGGLRAAFVDQCAV